MAQTSIETIAALRKTAENLQKSEQYQWGHMGSCNCGYLVQQVSHLKKNEIHESAMERCGDWTDQLNDYCPTSGLRIDSIISTMIDFGFTRDDLKHLERLSDPTILRMLPTNERNLKFNDKSDVIKYMLTWATKLENDLISLIEINAIEEPLVLQR